MHDVSIRVENRPGALAEMGEALGREGVAGLMHFLFQDGDAARRVLEAVKIEVVYSDHENQLILVVDKLEEGKAVSRTWEAERRAGEGRGPAS
jgi:hypothetical protein